MNTRALVLLALLSLGSIGSAVMQAALGEVHDADLADRKRSPTDGPPNESFDLNTFLASLQSLTDDEIIHWLEPIPTLEEVLDTLAQSAPPRPEMPADAAARVAQLTAKIDGFLSKGPAGHEGEDYDTALAEAIEQAKEVLAIRLRRQGSTVTGAPPSEWWQIGDARRAVSDLRLRLRLSAKQRADLQDARGDAAHAEALYAQGKYDQAFDLVAKRLTIERRLLGDVHANVAAGMNDLATMLWARGDYTSAELLHRRALQRRCKLLGVEHPDVATSLNNLSLALQAKGDFAAAEPLVRKAVALRYKLLGDEHPRFTTCVNNLATLLYSTGNYAVAEPLFRRALSLRRKLLGDEHPAVATCLNNLAEVLIAKGDYAAAEPLHREALALRIELLGEDHPDVGNSLNSLAFSLKQKGDYAAAEPLYHQALTLERRLLGNQHPRVAERMINLAALLMEKGEYETAEPLIREALALFGKLYGERHPHIAAGLSHLAVVLRANGDDAAAEAAYREALAMRRELLGNEHIEVAKSLSSLGLLQRDKGDYAAAEPLLVDAAEIFERARLRISTRGGLERVGLDARSSPLPDLAGVLLERGKNLDAWQSLERHFARGVLDELARGLSRPLTKQEREHEEQLIGQLSRLEERLSSTLAKPESQEREETLTLVRHRREKIQSEIAQFAAAMRSKYGVTAGKVYDLAHIQSSLAVDEALVAWLDVSGSPHSVQYNGAHWACIVRKTGGAFWARLPGTGVDGRWTKDDDSLPERFRQAVRSPLNRHARLADALYAQRIAPVVAGLADVRRLIVLPGGRMAGVPIDALTDRFTISYAPSATMFAWLAQKGRKAREASDGGKGALLALGDPLLQPASSLGPDAPGRLDASNLPQSAPAASHSNRSIDAALAVHRGTAYASLPATRSEVNALRELFGTGAGHVLLLGADASERKLAQLARAARLTEFRYLHFATHAVLDDQLAFNSALILAQDSLGDPHQRTTDNEFFDGRLTAQQIVRTWKLNAELVTLSACQTALGKASGGEGYLGFSQALLVAGARSMVLSLWKVDDAATALMMIRFYENLLGEYDQPRAVAGRTYLPQSVIPKADALREAKHWLQTLPAGQIANRLQRGGLGKGLPAGAQYDFSHPYFWAGFVLIGDPG